MRQDSRNSGFTLIELLVVMAILATLLTLATPRYYGSLDKAREAVLKENLASLRDAIDKHYSDTGRYPASLDALVAGSYLRRIPDDPVTESNSSWKIVPPADAGKGAVFDVRSGASGRARDGTPFAAW